MREYQPFSFQPIDNQTGGPQSPDWVIEELNNRGLGKTPQNTIMACLGEGTSGKSWTAARIIELLDPTFTPSLKNHPCYTGDIATSKLCHIMSEPGPFLEGLAENLYPRGTWIQLDEPPQATDWWTEVGRALTGFLTRYNYTLVNVAVCGILKRKVLSTIRDFAHIQIDQREPGHAAVSKLRNWKNYKSVTHEIIRKPKWAGPIGPGAAPPSDEFVKWYKGPNETGTSIKDWEWQHFARGELAKLKYKQAVDLKRLDKLRKEGYLRGA